MPANAKPTLAVAMPSRESAETPLERLNRLVAELEAERMVPSKRSFVLIRGGRDDA